MVIIIIILMCCFKNVLPGELLSRGGGGQPRREDPQDVQEGARVCWERVRGVPAQGGRAPRAAEQESFVRGRLLQQRERQRSGGGDGQCEPWPRK